MPDDPLALRIFLPVYFVAYIVLGLPFNLWLLRRRYGVDAGRVVKPHPISRLGDTYRDVMFGVALLMVGVYAVRPSALVWFVPIPYLDVGAVRVAGVVVLLTAFGVVRVAQSHMKASWRVGLDLGSAPTDLVTEGVYARSRNPIYLGMVATALGLFLVLPNAVTLAFVPLTVLLLQVRVRVEEAYLLDVHGETYREYCRRTSRWLLRPTPPTEI